MAVPAVIQPLTPGIVHLYGKRYFVNGAITESKISQFPSPVRTGEAERSDQQYASEVIWESLTGGIGVLHLDEREAPERYNFGSVFTLVKKRIMELPYPNEVATTGSAVAAYIGAVEFNSYVYFLGNNSPNGYIKRIPKNGTTMEFLENNAGTYSWVTTTAGGTEYTLPAQPFADPVIWKNFIWIPCQSGGIVRLDPTAATAPVTYSAFTARLAFIFDEDLIIITNPNGTTVDVYSTDDTTPTVAADWILRGSLDSVKWVVGATVHVNNTGDPTIWVSSNRGHHQLDYTAQKFYDAGISFHDDSGRTALAMTRWDGDLWFGKGANAHQVTSGARLVRGPNIGDGLPGLYQGWLRRFINGYDNFLIAMLDGIGASFSTIMAYNRRGWHPLAFGSDSYTNMIRVTDSFERVNSATTLGTADYADGGGVGLWVAGAGTWGVDVNRAYSVTPGANDVAVVDSGTADHAISVEITTNPSSATGARVIFRYTDAANYNFVQRTTVGYDLYTRSASVNTLVASTASFTPMDGDIVAITCTGNRIEVYVNSNYYIGVASVVTSAVNNTATKCGLGLGAAVAVRFKDLDVTIARRRIQTMIATFGGETETPHLWYGRQGSIFWFHLPDLTDNPERYPYIRPVGTGEIYYSWFDAGLTEIRKPALSCQTRVLDLNNGATITYYYALDDAGTWTQFQDVNGADMTVTTAGVHDLYFDDDRLGTLYYNVRIRAVFSGGTGIGSVSPKIVFFKIRHIRELDTLYGWNFDIDLSKPQPDERMPAMAIADLRAAVESKLLGKFAMQSGLTTDTKTVGILRYAGPTEVGPESSMRASVFVAELY